MSGRTVVTVLAVAGAVALVAGSCSKGDGKGLRPGPGGSLSTTTTAPDLSQVQLSAVSPGKTTSSTLPPGPGQASIFGRVVDDLGAPVPQALVRATWYLPAQPQIIEALTGNDGTYRFDQLRGGPWRIRAWKLPNLATLDAPAFFLGAKEAHAVDLKVKVVEDYSVTGRTAPEPPFIGEDTELAVLVLQQSVSGDGKVVRTPVPGAVVSLYVSGSWAFLGSSDPQPTDEQGVARWTMRCQAAGSQPITATAAGRDVTLNLQCMDPMSTSTTAPPETTTSSTTKKKRSTTTTTRRPGSPTTRGPVSPD
jgi:carboxypeptidase family protein